MSGSSWFLIIATTIFVALVIGNVVDHFLCQRRVKACAAAYVASPHNIRKCTVTIRYRAHNVETYRTGSDDVREFVWTFRGKKIDRSSGEMRFLNWLERWKARGVVPVSADESTLVPWERVLDMSRKIEDVLEP